MIRQSFRPRSLSWSRSCRNGLVYITVKKITGV